MSFTKVAPERGIAGAAVLALALGACLGCTHGGAHDAHASEEEEVREQLTRWSERHELFAEHAPLVAGARADFALHLTELARCAPVSEGSVVLRLAVGEAGAIEARAEAPARPGIFLVELVPSAAGPARLEVELLAADGVDRFGPIELLVHADEQSARASAAAASEPAGSIDFLKEQQWRLRTRTERALAGALVERIALPARLRPARGRRAIVSAPIAGLVIEAPGARARTLGERVEAGEVLLALRPPLSDFALRMVEARAELARAHAELELASAAEARVRGLFEERARSARELEEARAALAAAGARHDAARAALGVYERSGLVLPAEGQGEALLPYLELRAPIAGRIESIETTLGEFAPEGRALITLLDPSVVELEVRARPEQLARVDLASAVQVRGPRRSGARGELLESGAALLLAASAEVEPGSGTLALVYALENARGALHPGMAVEALLATAAAAEAPIVPLRALVDVDGEDVLYVQLGGESFEKRHVLLGARDGERVQVLEGLAPGERVVVERPGMLRLAAASGAVPAHDHAH